MDAFEMLPHLNHRLRRIVGREDGSSTVELAIVFPILLIMFVGTAELGRLLYTYTTLAKATKVGARYLSTSRDVSKGTPDQIGNAKNEARNLVICGFKNCTNQTPIVPGLTPANVLICDNFSVPCEPALAGGPIKYFKVEIRTYTYSPSPVWNLAAMTGLSDSTFYFPLAPGTEMRYMP